MDWQWVCSAWSLRFVKNQGSSRNCVRAGDAERCVGMAGLSIREAGYDRVKAMVDEDGLKGCAVVISEGSPAAANCS